MSRAMAHRAIGLGALGAGVLIGMLAVMPLVTPPAWAQAEPRVVTPSVDAARGRMLFVRRACVVCHSVNGIGGRMGPALDADPRQSEIDVADFAARMWRGAGPMVWLQTLELGYQLDMSGEDIGHIAAFANDLDEQRRFEENEVPGRILESLLNEPYRRPEDWLWEPDPEPPE